MPFAKTFAPAGSEENLILCLEPLINVAQLLTKNADVAAKLTIEINFFININNNLLV
ncbi:hypothetical protein AGMMS4956_11060 [Bacteroidia bacterium]|nr:hypothetical protein AGMMS4956_11060 [Bacteroidia bacterium]